MIELIEKLEYAKKATKSCLDDEAVSVDFHGLAYWAKRVETLRTEIKEKL